MPTVLIVNGFHFRMWHNDHPPMHVHVRKGGGEVILIIDGLIPIVRDDFGMSPPDVRRAISIAYDNVSALRHLWRQIHNERVL